MQSVLDQAYNDFMREHGGQVPMGYTGAINGGTSGGGVTTINSDGSVSTDRQGGGSTQVATYADGTKVVTSKGPDGSTSLGIYSADGAVEISSRTSSGIKTVYRKDVDGMEETRVTDSEGNLIGGSLKEKDGSYESFFINSQGETVRMRIKDGVTSHIVEATWGVRSITREDAVEKEARTFNESGVMTSRELYWHRGTPLEAFHIEEDRNGVIYTSVRNASFDLSIIHGTRVEVTTVNHISENGQSRELSRNTIYVEYNYGERPTTETDQSFGSWIMDGAIETWNGLVGDESADGIKSGVTRVGSGTEKVSIGLTVGTKGNDALSSNGVLAAGTGNDTLTGGKGADILIGGIGNDIMSGCFGSDFFEGGNGTDYVVYGTAVVINLSDSSQNTGEAAGDTYRSVEIFQGSDDSDRMTGNGEGNIFFSAGGNDRLSGLDGNDQLLGGDGDDTLVGGAGADQLYGSNGVDYVEYSNAPSGVVVDLLKIWRNTGDARGDSYDRIEGFRGSGYKDELFGTHESHEFYGNGGDDVLEGRGGGDYLDGGEGYDFAVYWSAASGVTASLANAAQNTGDAAGDSYTAIEGLQGSEHGDMLEGSTSNNDLHGRDGNDQLYGLDGRDFLSGGAGDDRLHGGAGADWLHGGDGFDIVEYATATAGVLVDRQDMTRNTGDAAGDEYQDDIEGLSGSAHGDQLYDDGGSHELYGNGGNDRLWGRDGNDYLEGGDGDDRLYGGAGLDTFNGGDGFDIVEYSDATAGVQMDRQDRWRGTGDAAGDFLQANIEGVGGSAYADRLYDDGGSHELYGNGGNDELWGRDGNDYLEGGDGDDVLNGGSGADRLNGGAGVDTASYAMAAGVVADLATGRGYGDAAGDVYLSVEGLDGSGYGDTLIGNEAANSLNGLGGNDELLGQAGADTLAGGSGHDTLMGGSGVDHLTGGTGSDVFRFDAAGAGHADVITDFAVGVDQIQLDTRFFSGLPAPVAPEPDWSGAVYGSLASGAFGLGAGASTWAQRVIYNGSTGELFYDADGVGAGAQVKIAQLSSGLALSSASFSTYAYL